MILDLEYSVNSELKTYYEWLCYNKLSLNVNKTDYMVIKQKNNKMNDPIVMFNVNPLKKVTEYKYLGLMISNKLT